MFNVTGGEVLLVGLVALLVLGPKRLPDAARSAGRVIGQIRSISEGFQREVRDALDIDAPAATQGPVTRSVSEVPPRPNLDVDAPEDLDTTAEGPDAG
ncbi:MAG: twin-arginine translocase subunit TatB [Actinobacteria bacterium]|nr:twin-arginine translocase subunit TatB [Actinomycetota bacterium]